MTTEDQVRSLTRKEVQVLYWRCKGKLNKEIALQYGKTEKAIETLMTGIYGKLGIDKKVDKTDRLAYLSNDICPIVLQLIGENEDNLERWPLYGVRVTVQKRGITAYAEKEVDDTPKEPDPRIMDLILIDQGEVIDEPSDSPALELPKQDRTPPPSPGWGRFGVLGGVGLFFLCLVIFAWFAGRPILNRLAPSASPTHAVSTTDSGATQIVPTNTSVVTSFPSATLEPSATPTPENPPTAVPLPIKENFSQPVSSLWEVFGDPFLSTGRTDFGDVLTTRQDDRVAMRIGNTSWTDYEIRFRANNWGIYGSVIILGVRYIDANNMIQLNCLNATCKWIVISDGQRDELQADKWLEMHYQIIITVAGDKFTAWPDPADSGLPDMTYSFTLPPKYSDKFKGGGVMLEISNAEIDYFEIHSLR